MISIEKALEIIYNNVTKKSTHIIPIEASIGSIVAKDYHATFDLPRFDNSAMDGYAVKVADAGKEVTLKEVTYAGDRPEEVFQHGEVIKIMTGAPTPNGCEAIVPIEDVEVNEKTITLPSHIKENAMIRWKGEDIKSGTPFLFAQTKVTAYTLALLTSQGMTHIEVYRKPKVVIFSTGEELKAHYERIEQHQLYNSNAPMFYARAKELGCDVSYITSSGDTLESLKLAVHNATDADLILTSGGVSVGDKDFTKQAFWELGMETLFSGIDIKPGKPTTFGKLGNCFVVNLPGNPLAAMVNFEMFVKPILLKISGTKSFYHPLITTKMRHEYTLRAGKYAVILGEWDGDSFAPLKNQKPGMVSPLNRADGMIVVTREIDHLNENQMVKMIPIKIDLQSDKKEDFFIR
ncbi:molybdopterin molybdotransferase MoeA [bacterium]|nr:molybdopterin molybdotransferase MoeA [bacterium]MBU1959385.1 molybdopterin molybdotransferase MoeA [bacterium]